MLISFLQLLLNIIAAWLEDLFVLNEPYASLQLKIRVDAYLFLGRPREFARPRSTNPRLARDD
jgi:hypothetical protein